MIKSSLAPTPINKRIIGLDVLRGVALFGILVVNMSQYFQISEFANKPISMIPDEQGVWGIWGLIYTLFDTKFFTVFSFLFGLSFALQWQRAEATNRKYFPKIYRKRLLFLALFGIIHGVFFYSADVLFMYAIAGLILFWYRKKDAGKLMRGGFILLLIIVLWNHILETSFVGFSPLKLIVSLLIILVPLLFASKLKPTKFIILGICLLIIPIMLFQLPSNIILDEHKEFNEKLNMVQEYNTLNRSEIEIDGNIYDFPPDYSITKEVLFGNVNAPTFNYLAYTSGNFKIATLTRLSEFKTITFFGFILYIWRSLGIFLIAAGLVKWGILQDEKKPLWKKYAFIGLVVGLSLSILATLLKYNSYQGPHLSNIYADFLHDISSYLLAIGISAQVMIWSNTKILNAIRIKLSEVGKMALTNYLGQSFIMSIIANGYGLGLHSNLSLLNQLSLAIIVFIIMALLSSLWLKYFKMGPLEWVWRCLSYGKFLGLKK
jgi:uncharacterized protein